MKSVTASIGGRVEGIPVYDLIGESGEFRRPGYIVSIEPGITYHLKQVQFFATAPVALFRNRTQSVTDKENSTLTGDFVQGDAAFADYAINFGLSFPINGKSKTMGPDTPALFKHIDN